MTRCVFRQKAGVKTRSEEARIVSAVVYEGSVMGKNEIIREGVDGVVTGGGLDAGRQLYTFRCGSDSDGGR